MTHRTEVLLQRAVKRFDLNLNSISCLDLLGIDGWNLSPQLSYLHLFTICCIFDTHVEMKLPICSEEYFLRPLLAQDVRLAPVTSKHWDWSAQ